MVDLHLHGIGNIECINAVIFDKDGTLIDVHVYWTAMIRMRAQLLCSRLGLGPEQGVGLMDSMGVDVGKKRVKPAGPVGIQRRSVVQGAAIGYLNDIGLPGQDGVVEDVFAVVDDTSSKNLDECVKPIRGARELVLKLKSFGCKVVMATTDLSRRARLALKTLGLEEVFDAVVGADMVTNAKPDPEMIYVALQRCSVPKEGAVMVGDAITDLQMGELAGVKASIGVTSGLTDVHELQSVTPYVIPDVSHIIVSK